VKLHFITKTYLRGEHLKMKNTFKNFQELATLYSGQTSNLDELALNYQESQDPVLLAVVFCKQYPYILTQVDKYFNLSEADKSSFAVEELHKAMNDFKTEKGAKIQTLFSRYLNRRLYAETNMLNHQKRSANNTADSYEEVMIQVTQGYDEVGYSDCDFYNSLIDSELLTVNELKYCRIIMRETSKLTDSEVARELNVSPSAVNQMKKALKKKFLSLSICYS
jgi:DNA-directed RNA polymerase specialized sigma subunit